MKSKKDKVVTRPGDTESKEEMEEANASGTEGTFDVVETSSITLKARIMLADRGRKQEKPTSMSDIKISGRG